jgi:hypothetical protein
MYVGLDAAERGGAGTLSPLMLFASFLLKAEATGR